MDPSHANWLHDGGVGKWEDSAPLNMRLVDNAIDANKVSKSAFIMQCHAPQPVVIGVIPSAMPLCLAYGHAVPHSNQIYMTYETQAGRRTDKLGYWPSFPGCG